MPLADLLCKTKEKTEAERDNILNRVPKKPPNQMKTLKMKSLNLSTRRFKNKSVLRHTQNTNGREEIIKLTTEKTHSD